MEKNNQQIASPLLRLLIDEAPDLSYEKNTPNYIGFQTLKNDIRDNLEMILNARRHYLTKPARLTQISESILNYGIVDFTQQYYSLDKNQSELREAIRKAITYFEPRLQAVRVTMVEPEEGDERSFRIRIDGLIQIKPEPQQAAFESQLDLVRYQFSFEEEKS
jgi:type VI secretion system protein ImpF